MGLFGDILGYINAGRAANSISDANIAAEHGVLNAVQGGQAGVNSAVTSGQGGVSNALLQALSQMQGAQGNAVTDVNGATGNANNNILNFLSAQNGNIKPYLDAGAQGTAGLEAYAKSNPQFNFDPSKYLNSDAMKFQQQQGDQAIQNSMSAQGLGSSGSAMKELSKYNQGVASQYYQQAFNDAQSTFQTNQNATMQNLGALTSAGEFGTGQYNQSMENAGNTISQNTLGAGYYGGNTGLSVAQLLSQLGLQGSEFNSSTGLQGAESNAKLGLTGSELAGNYAVGAGTAHAGGILGQGNNLAGAGSDLATMLLSLGLGG